MKRDTCPYFLLLLELKPVEERKRYDMLISDSRTIGLGSEEPEKKMSSKLGWGDSGVKALGSVENAAVFSPSKKGCDPDLRREKKLSWII